MGLLVQRRPPKPVLHSKRVMPTSETVFLIDGTAQMYRAYHAIRNLTGPDGKSTNAVFGFVTMLRKLINDHRPELIAAAFDLRGPTSEPKSLLITKPTVRRCQTTSRGK
ncbi:MAG: hypothetical protein Ct9H300mP25_08200 [Acidobacteriota bacterium]|nr:MAG: hypothetical protein Ct9H300mP25_08200 [Acidobacteriota bacterium]